MSGGDGAGAGQAHNDRSPAADLVLDLDELEREGAGPHRRAAELPAAWISEVLSSTDARASRPGSAELEISIQGDGTVLVRGSVNAQFEVPCARCLDDASVDASSASVVLTFVPAERLADWAAQASSGDEEDDGIELAAEDLDQVPYRGRKIDLRVVLGEQIAIAYPMRALCRLGEACLGLCPSCGANLNDRPTDADPSRCHVCGSSLDDPAGAAEEERAEAREASGWHAALRKLRGEEP